MINIAYIKNGEKAFDMSYDNDIIIAEVAGVTGASTDLKTSQGTFQTGSNVDGVAVGGRDIVINGYILDADTEKKQKLIRMFAPKTQGRFFWENEYFVDTYVRSSPEITQEKHSRFSLTLYAPFPFWRRKKEKTFVIGDFARSSFSYPIKNLKTHVLGVSENKGVTEIKNRGDVSAIYKLELLCGAGNARNIVLHELNSNKKLFINGTLNSGDKISINYENNEMKVIKTNGVSEENAFKMLGLESNFFEILPGKNKIEITADEGSAFLKARLSFHETYSGVLADGV